MRKSPPPFTAEHRRKIGEANSRALRGRKLSAEHCKRISEYNLRVGRIPPDPTGRVLSIETRAKIGEANKGKDHWWAVKGERHHWWKGGITPLRTQIYHSIEYRNWRKRVFERDNYTCQECGIVGGLLHADHIKPFSYYPELRFELSNGRTLCVPCHWKTPTYGVGVHKGYEKTAPTGAVSLDITPA